MAAAKNSLVKPISLWICAWKVVRYYHVKSGTDLAMSIQ